MALRFEILACLSRDALAALALTLAACGGAPVAAEPGSARSEPEGRAAPARRRADAVDDCAVVPGKPPPEPLLRKYEGVAAGARCQREVYTIMGGVSHFLGVKCEHCHVKDDYPAPTHNKSVANWMARELIPRLEKKHAGAASDGARIWCNDCHVVDGQGTAKLLGDPRRQAWAIEWMSTHLTDRFERSSDDRALRCKDCHGANLGSPEFRKKIILTDSLPPEPELEALADADADAGAGALEDGGRLEAGAGGAKGE